MSFGGELSETFEQISAAGAASMHGVNVSITDGGNIIGQGVIASAHGLEVSGGSLDAIIQSFGGDITGIQGGGKDKIKHKVDVIMSKAKHSGSKLDSHLEKQLKELHNHAVDLEEFAALAKSALKEDACSQSVHAVLEKIASHVDSGARAMRSVLEKDLKQPKQKVSDFLARNKQFSNVIKTLGAHLNEPNVAGMVSLSFSNVNELKKMGKSVSEALKDVDMKKKEYLGQSLANLDRDLTDKLEEALQKGKSSDKIRAFLKGWKTLLEHHGHSHKLSEFIGGAGVTSMGSKLADRLYKSREELKNIINKFIMAFGSDLNDIVDATNELSKHLGKDIPYSDETVQFLDAFTRLNEYLNNNRARFYQHLLEINTDQVDSREIKARFLNNLRVLSEKASEMGSSAVVKKFVSECESAASNVHKFSDMIKSFREDVKKDGGNATDVMNELYSVDASKIEISALINPLENLQIAIKKLQFFKNIAIFRSNLSQTNKELAVYSKDYEASVGKSIGEAITRITNEYTEIINQVSDTKSGMGLEIDMYNESLAPNQKISKEKLKIMYKWQCDARVGLYKTIEAIDLYLLHFTDAISKNPDAVSDLHKLLSATKIIARWYDQKAGENLIRVFESFRDGINDDTLENQQFINDYAADSDFADLSIKLGGDRASKVYERCRRAVQGVVVLKNIISYFMSLGEKYGDYKSEKSIYMAPSNIYKNLVNYIWVSALDINTTGTEVLTDNNETKRLLTYEDTKVKLAQITSIDPETMGINFNRHSIDKLRILKCHNELLRLRDATASMTDLDIRRIKQFVAGTFARLGKTKYIFPMFLFGVYDLSQMDRPLLTDFIAYIERMRAAPVGPNPNQFARLADPDARVNRISIAFALPAGEVRTNAVDIVDQIMALTPEQRSVITARASFGPPDYRNNTFVNLKAFMAIREDTYANDDAPDGPNGIVALNGLVNTNITQAGARRDDQRYIPTDGFLKGFLSGLTSNSQEVGSVVYAQRVVAVLHYCVMDMMNTFKREQSSSVFAIDDTYFILTVKAIAGKVMTIAGVNSLFKNPASYRNTIGQNKTRLIMGGADSILEDPEVIDEAIELYVRLPLLIEFYRNIFNNANKEYKQESLGAIGALDEEEISFVPEIGNIWSNLIKNIFDKSKHIENGVYTPENMRKIVSEVNAIFKHYKSSAPAESVVRHIILELVAEINRRYGVIKRQELLNYYRVVNSTKRNRVDIGESNYSNNDFDILNEEVEFEEKSPSDAFINLKSTLADSNITKEVKINKLTDYRILKDFRGRIDTAFAEPDLARAGEAAGANFLTMVDRIRMLKKAVTTKNSRDEKYDMIIKAIEESEAMNQSSNDIFACFHEFVVVPMRMAYQMYKTYDEFITSLYSVLQRVAGPGHNAAFDDIAINPILLANIKIGDRQMSFIDGVLETIRDTEVSLLSSDVRGIPAVINFGRGIARFDIADPNRPIINVDDNAPISVTTTQILLTDILTRFCQNSGNLAKMTISTTGRITVDLSEFQTLCEYLVSNTKFMIDKFTGLVPTALIENVTKADRVGSIYWLDNNLINLVFNKINKSESERAIKSIDNLNKVMPLISNVVLNTASTCSELVTKLVLTNKEPGFGSQQTSVCLPVVRDAFMQYDQQSRIFKTSDRVINICNTLFTPSATTSIVEGNNQHGLIQEFNTLIAHYLNDLYDQQSRKMYPKLFEKFANNAFLEALNGQAYADFTVSADGVLDGVAEPISYYKFPANQSVLSATLAYVMKSMSTRTHPISGVKVHEIATLQEVAAHVLEKYRSCLPMYLRLFKIFLERCKFYRKTLSKMQIDDAVGAIGPIGDAAIGVLPVGRSAVVRENSSDTYISFAATAEDIDAFTNAQVRDRALLFIDDMVSGISSLIEDATSVHKELREMDDSVPLFFDVKHNFTKTFYLGNKDLPFAPLSTLSAALNNSANSIQPFPTVGNASNSKFLYGIQSMLIDDFKLTVGKVPYMKKLLADFNGYSTKVNSISEDKFNDLLKYLGSAFSFYYDWKFYNGQVFGATSSAPMAAIEADAVAVYEAAEAAYAAAVAAAAPGAAPVGPPAPTPLVPKTFQETNSRDSVINLLESINPIDSKNKVADEIKSRVVSVAERIGRPLIVGQNPRRRVIMVNIIDLGIVPINVHSLMREVPLANLYNYAMTFDSFVSELGLSDMQRDLLLKPYTPLAVTDAADGTDPTMTRLRIQTPTIGASPLATTIATTGATNSLRFINDVIFSTMVKPTQLDSVDAAGVRNYNLERVNERINSKLVRNLTFLTLVQYAIKKKVKTELDFINTRVVSNTAAVSDTITTAADGINDNLFEF